LSHGGQNLAEGVPLANAQKKVNDGEFGCRGCLYQLRKKRKHPKSQEKQQPTENKRILNISKCQLKGAQFFM